MSRSISTPPSLENASFRRSLRIRKWEEQGVDAVGVVSVIPPDSQTQMKSNSNNPLQMGEIVVETSHHKSKQGQPETTTTSTKDKRNHNSTMNRKDRSKIRSRRLQWKSKAKKNRELKAKAQLEQDNNSDEEEDYPMDARLHASDSDKMEIENPRKHSLRTSSSLMNSSFSDSAIGSNGTIGSHSEDQYWESISNPDANVRITVDQDVILIPLQNILAREREMRKLATEQGIDKDRWNGSLLYRKVRYASVKNEVDNWGHFDIEVHLNGSSSAPDPRANDAGGRQSLIPVKETKSHHDDSIPSWAHLLHTTITPYYSIGRIPVPDASSGPDLLHLLEFFELVYSPSLLDFQTFGAYIRVRLWGEYFFQRLHMSNWIMDQIYSATTMTPKKSIYLVTSPENVQNMGMHYVLKGTGIKCMLFEGGLNMMENETRGMTNKSESNCALIYEFFNADDPSGDAGNSVDLQLREDFRAFIQTSLVGSTASFEMKDVELISNTYSNSIAKKRKSVDVVGKRAVLHISFSRTKSSTNNAHLTKFANGPFRSKNKQSDTKPEAQEVELKDYNKQTNIKSKSSSSNDQQRAKPPSSIMELDDSESDNSFNRRQESHRFQEQKHRSNRSSHGMAPKLVSPEQSRSAPYNGTEEGKTVNKATNDNVSNATPISTGSESDPCPATPPSRYRTSFDTSLEGKETMQKAFIESQQLASAYPLTLSESIASRNQSLLTSVYAHKKCVSLDEANASWLWAYLQIDSFLNQLDCCCPDDANTPIVTSTNDLEFDDATKLTNFHSVDSKANDPAVPKTPETIPKRRTARCMAKGGIAQCLLPSFSQDSRRPGRPSISPSHSMSSSFDSGSRKPRQ